MEAESDLRGRRKPKCCSSFATKLDSCPNGGEGVGDSEVADAVVLGLEGSEQICASLMQVVTNSSCNSHVTFGGLNAFSYVLCPI